jgi:hypothetical protein
MSRRWNHRPGDRPFASGVDRALLHHEPSILAATAIARAQIRALNRGGRIKLDLENAGYYAAEALFALAKLDAPPKSYEAYVAVVARNLALRDLLIEKLACDPVWKRRHELTEEVRAELARELAELPETAAAELVSREVEDRLIRRFGLVSRVPAGDEVVDGVAGVGDYHVELRVVLAAMLSVYRREQGFTDHDRDTFELWIASDCGAHSIQWDKSRYPARDSHAYEQRLSKMLARLRAALVQLEMDPGSMTA